MSSRVKKKVEFDFILGQLNLLCVVDKAEKGDTCKSVCLQYVIMKNAESIQQFTMVVRKVISKNMLEDGKKKSNLFSIYFAVGNFGILSRR